MEYATLRTKLSALIRWIAVAGNSIPVILIIFGGIGVVSNFGKFPLHDIGILVLATSPFWLSLPLLLYPSINAKIYRGFVLVESLIYLVIIWFVTWLDLALSVTDSAHKDELLGLKIIAFPAILLMLNIWVINHRMPSNKDANLTFVNVSFHIFILLLMVSSALFAAIFAIYMGSGNCSVRAYSYGFSDNAKKRPDYVSVEGRYDQKFFCLAYKKYIESIPCGKHCGIMIPDFPIY